MSVPDKAVNDVLEQFKGRPVAALEAAYRAKVESNQRIQSQLSDKDKRDVDGVRVTDREYHAWRVRAVGALRHGLAEQRALKEALKIARRRFNTDTPLRSAEDLRTPDQLIHAAVVVLHRLAGELGGLEEEEQRVKDALDLYLREHGVVGS